MCTKVNISLAVATVKFLSHSLVYSDFMDAEMTKPGHNYLPLGPAFQEHVACFLKYVSSTAKLLLHMQPPGCKEMGSYQGVK